MDKIIYLSDNKIGEFDLKTREEEFFELPDKSSISAQVEKNKLFLLKENSIDIYSVK